MNSPTAPAARVLVLCADGFEEIELVTVVDVLRRAGLAVLLASPTGGSLRGAHGLRIDSEARWSELHGGDFAALVLPGGMENARTLERDPDALRLLREGDAAGRLLAAICAAPVALQAAGVLRGAAHTSHPAVQAELPATSYRTARVVQDGRIVTSRGPGTALEFALALVKALCGDEQAAAVAAPMLVA